MTCRPSGRAVCNVEVYCGHIVRVSSKIIAHILMVRSSLSTDPNITISPREHPKIPGGINVGVWKKWQLRALPLQSLI